MDQDGTWHRGRPWSSPHCARWGHSSPLQKRRQSPQFSAHLYCGQTAGCIKMPLGMEVGLSPGNFVLDGDQPPTPKGVEPNPIFGPRLLWPNGWMDEDAAWYGSRPRPRPHCIRPGPSSREWGTAASPLFGPCLLWPRSPISATAELLLLLTRAKRVVVFHWVAPLFKQFVKMKQRGTEMCQELCKLVQLFLKMWAIDSNAMASLDFVSEKTGCWIVDFILIGGRHFVTNLG